MGPTPDEQPPKRNGYYCAHCDKLMSAWYTKARFCSQACINAARPRKIYTCSVCERIWEPRNRQTQNKRKTCSEKCRSLLQTWRQTGRRIPTKIVSCPICQKDMPLRHSSGHLRKGCSRKCGVLYSYRFNLNRKKRGQRKSTTSPDAPIST